MIIFICLLGTLAVYLVISMIHGVTLGFKVSKLIGLLALAMLAVPGLHFVLTVVSLIKTFTKKNVFEKLK